MRTIPARMAYAFGFVAVAVAACSAGPSTPRASALIVALPTVGVVPRVCGGVGGGGTLHGDPNDERVAWSEGFGERGELVWPPGFVARFDPDLEVLDRNGNVFLRDGDTLPGGCAVGPADDPPSLVLIIPEPTG